MVANGDGPRDNPAIKALNLGPLGQAVRSSAIATKTLLFVTEGDQLNPRTPPGGGGRKFRALDKDTGKTLWEIELEAGANGAPMTYLFNGKQYVVLGDWRAASSGGARRLESAVTVPSAIRAVTMTTILFGASLAASIPPCKPTLFGPAARCFENAARIATAQKPRATVVRT